MAGGSWTSANKAIPGVYVNFKNKVDNIYGSNGGTVIMPILSGGWFWNGDAKSSANYAIVNASTDTVPIIGVDYRSANDNMSKAIRGALMNAETVVLAKPSVNATQSTATATLGSDEAEITSRAVGTNTMNLKVTFEPNTSGGVNVVVYLSNVEVERFTGVKTFESLLELNSNYVEFDSEDEGNITISATVTVSLTGGSGMAEATFTDTLFSSYLSIAESIHWDVLVAAVGYITSPSLLVSFMNHLHNDIGIYRSAVVSATINGYDNEYITAVANSVVTSPEINSIAWVAGAMANIGADGSLTYKKVDGATDINGGNPTDSVATDYINRGLGYFSVSETGDIVYTYDINTLITFTSEKGEMFRKNRVIRSLNAIATDIVKTFPPNKFDNNDYGYDGIEALGKALLLDYKARGVLKDVVPESDFVVDRTKSNGENVFVNVAITPVDSVDKLYFTVVTRV